MNDAIKPDFEWSAAQRAVFDWAETGRGSAVVVAVAGAGKTTTMVEVAKRLGGKGALVAYNKAMGDELRARTRGTDGVRAGTVHSFGYGACKFRWMRDAARAELDRWIDDKKTYHLLDECVAEARRAGAEAHKLEKVEAFAGFAARAVALAKDRGFGFLAPYDDDRAWFDLVSHFGLEQYLPEAYENDADGVEYGVRLAVKLLRRSAERTDVIDFGDMIWLPLVHNLRFFQQDWVIVDEAQDTNPARRAIVRKMLRPGGRMIAVGDPHQAIYGFTGADNDALDQLRRDFDAVELPLTVSYRCPRAVVEHAREVVAHIEPAPAAPEGVVRVASLLLDPQDDLAESTDEADRSAYETYCQAREAGTLVVPADLTPEDAVLCRLNAPLVALAFALIRRGVGARIEGRDVGKGLIALVNRWKVKKLDALEARLDAYLQRETQKALSRGDEGRADRLADQVETVKVFVARAREAGETNKAAVVRAIEDLFGDDVGRAKDVVTLASVHRFKGRERPRVFLLNRRAYMPSPFARQAWQVEQERNLEYVAITRAQEELVELSWEVRR